MTTADIDLALARFELTEPVTLEDMSAIAAHLRATFPGSKVDVYRHRITDEFTTCVERDVRIYRTMRVAT